MAARGCKGGRVSIECPDAHVSNPASVRVLGAVNGLIPPASLEGGSVRLAWRVLTGQRTTSQIHESLRLFRANAIVKKLFSESEPAHP